MNPLVGTHLVPPPKRARAAPSYGASLPVLAGRLSYS